MLDLPRDEWPANSRAVAAALGELLRALHGADVERMAELVPTDDCSLSERLQEAARDYASVAGQVPVAYRRSVEAFLTARPPAGGRALVFSHNDLGIEHVLVDPRSWLVTGIIDWSDAAIVDPAHDVGLIYRDLGPEAAEIAVRSCGTDQEDDAAFGERVVFHARCGVIEDLAYGISIDRGAYVEKSLAALEWLFAR
jgi:aminoglycoside phosphotransferase (APT) family kinase protein